MADAQGGSAPHVPEQPAGENQTDNEATVTQNSPNSQEIADTALEDHHELAIDVSVKPIPWLVPVYVLSTNL